ncbi:MAG: hypothetical protein FJX51_11615, partial [Alphaproteobacteria bacterium]|nr:hypothetical protein [Alphaproteobacteria bacterium]
MARDAQAFLLAAFLVLAASAGARAAEVPRVVLGLYDGGLVPYRFSQIHQMAEMPLNHLGLVVRPHDVREPLPPIERMPEVRGVLTAFTMDAAFADPETYLAWIERALAAGKRVVVLNYVGVDRARDGRAVPPARVNRAFAGLGLRFTRDTVGLTYSVRAPRAAFALPQAEAGSHTYSHLFYPPKRAKRRSSLGAWLGTEKPEQSNWASGEAGGKPEEGAYGKAYRVPRAYAVKPYDLDHEIKG